MEIRDGCIEDFDGVATFVSEAIAETFYRPDLNDEEIRSNERIAEMAHPCLLKAINSKDQKVFVALVSGTLAGFLILSDVNNDVPELDWLMVAQEFQGKGVAHRLMEKALTHISSNKSIKLGVIHYNARAKTFYKKYGFKETGDIAGNHTIPRSLMLRDASVCS